MNSSAAATVGLIMAKSFASLRRQRRVNRCVTLRVTATISQEERARSRVMGLREPNTQGEMGG